MGSWEAWPERGPGYKIRYSKSGSRVRVRIPKGGGPTDYRTGVVEDIGAKPKPKPKSKTPWPIKSQTGRGGKLRSWVPHPKKPGWEINVMTMDERKMK